MKSKEQALFDKREAARFLGCSVSHFEESIRPQIPEVDLADPTAKRPMPRWRRSDLEAFVERRIAA